MSLRSQLSLSSKTHAGKIGNIHEDFELYQVFMNNFLFQNVPLFLLNILLTRRIVTFWSDGFDTFWSGGIGTVSAQKITKGKSTILTKILNYTKSSQLEQTISKF